MDSKDMHPSGMTWERWDNPFKSDAERALVIKWNKKCNRAEKRDWYDTLEEAPF